MRTIAHGLAIALAAILLPGWTSPDAVETILHRFDGDHDGASPSDGLIIDERGTLYGTTASGGPAGAGTVFRLTPPGADRRNWTRTVLHSFKSGDPNDGESPMGRLIFDRQGALYGTTKSGGSKDLGTVFKLTPPADGQTAWTETVLHSFAGSGADGSSPTAGLIFDREGALYGTTLSGGGVGKNGHGAVFRLTPPAAGRTVWTETVIYRFKGGNDGANPFAALIADEDGALYGTTLSGGTPGEIGKGTVFRLTPPAAGGPAWTETVLYRFAGGPGDGDSAEAGLVVGRDGALYGATFLGGGDGNQGAGYGVIFRLTPPAADRSDWTESVLYRFCAQPACGDGSIPEADLVLGSEGALYGATVSGGDACARYPQSGCGTIFKLTPPAEGKVWTETVLHRFAGGTDGIYPLASLVLDRQGALYGATTSGGGADGDGYGVVFKLTPCAATTLGADDRDYSGCPALVSALAPVTGDTQRLNRWDPREARSLSSRASAALESR
jgi:uncharacterized repeat protein (TIGR03803 family)